MFVCLTTVAFTDILSIAFTDKLFPVVVIVVVVVVVMAPKVDNVKSKNQNFVECVKNEKKNVSQNPVEMN